MSVAPYQILVSLIGDEIHATIPGEASDLHHTLKFPNDLFGCRMLLRILKERQASHARGWRSRLGEPSQLTQAQAEAMIAAWRASRPEPAAAAKVREAENFLQELGL